MVLCSCGCACSSSWGQALKSGAIHVCMQLLISVTGVATACCNRACAQSPVGEPLISPPQCLRGTENVVVAQITCGFGNVWSLHLHRSYSASSVAGNFHLLSL